MLYGILHFSHLYSNTLPVHSKDPYSHLTDEELLQAYRLHGDSRHIGSLLQRYTLLLLGVAMKYLKDKEQAQDAVQQVFLKALTHLPTGDIHNFKGWLYVLMRNHCLQQLRDKTYKVGEEAIPNLPADEPVQEDEITYTPAQLNEALEALNQEQKQSVMLFYLKKMSYQQIMEQTGYTFTQVKSYIQNGKRNLKAILLKHKRR